MNITATYSELYRVIKLFLHCNYYSLNLVSTVEEEMMVEVEVDESSRSMI